MPDSPMLSSEERIYLLNSIEVCTTIFHGPDSKGWAAALDLALMEMQCRPPENLRHLTALINTLQESLPASSGLSASELDLDTEYVRLFVTGSGGVPAPLYESCHLEDKPRTMGESSLAMRTRLDKAGLEIALKSNEPADHLTLELEYLYYLLSTGWAEDNPALITDGATFAKSVMLPWVQIFRDKLAGAEPHPTYLRAADLVLATLDSVSKI